MFLASRLSTLAVHTRQKSDVDSPNFDISGKKKNPRISFFRISQICFFGCFSFSERLRVEANISAFVDLSTEFGNGSWGQAIDFCKTQTGNRRTSSGRRVKEDTDTTGWRDLLPTTTFAAVHRISCATISFPLF